MSAPTDGRVEIGRRIKSVRLSRDMTLQGLSDATGVSVAYLSEVERGLSAITFEKLRLLARALRVSVQFLAEGDGKAIEEGDEIRIPAKLSEAAEQLGLSHHVTLRLLQGKESLRAQRSRDGEREWTAEDWIGFYNRVKDYLPEPKGAPDAKRRSSR